VELESSTMTMRMRAAGATAGERAFFPQPWLRSFTAMPAQAGRAIETSMLNIMPATSTCTVCPRSSLSVSGMVRGEATVETSSVASVRERLPWKSPVHMTESTATGTAYSSTSPHMMSGSEPKKMPPSRKTRTGMITAETSSDRTIGSGCRTVSARFEKLLPRAPWKVMKANITVT